MALRASQGAVRKSRFTEDRMVRILRGADEGSVPKIARHHGVSGRTIVTWRKRHAELDVPRAAPTPAGAGASP